MNSWIHIVKERAASSAPQGARWRNPAALAFAGALGLAGLGIATTQPNSPVVAQEAGGSTNFAPFQGAPASFADLIEDVRNSVVSVNVKGGGKTAANRRGGGEGNDIPRSVPKGFEEFFKRFGQQRPGGRPRPRPSQAQGSGFIISPDGYVVTNNHVIDNADEITVTLDNRDKFDAELVGTDARTDLALLKIKKPGRRFDFVRFSKNEARVGDWVVAVGNPFGLGGTVTAGIISAKSRDIGSGPYDYLQIDAAVNKGNSGGPSFNLNGEVVGVNTAIFSPSGGNVGIAFAVPAKLATQVIAELRSKGTVSRGWLGVRIQNITPDIAASLGLAKSDGALVTELTPGGPAEKSKLRVGDAVLSVNGTRIENSRDLARGIANLEPGDIVNVGVLREGREQSIDVKLGQFPSGKRLASLSSPAPESEVKELEALGLSLAPATVGGDEDAEGVLVTEVDQASEAATKGIRKGDVILEVGGKKVGTPKDVARGVQSAERRGRKAVLLRLQTGENQRFVALPLDKG